MSEFKAMADIKLDAKYEQREQASELGARWNKEHKTWYAPKGSNLSDFKDFMKEDKITIMNSTYLNVPFSEKNQAKELGAYFDGERKEWYAPAFNNIKDYPSKWFEDKEKSLAIDTDKVTFKEFATNKGLIIDDLVADGAFHRVSVVGGKPNAKDGSYVCYDDSNGKAGFIQNWKTGEKATYGEMSGEKYTAFKADIDTHKQERKIEQQELYDKKAKVAQGLISSKFKVAGNDHPYLQNKDVRAHQKVKVDDKGALIIPLVNSEGKIRTFQRIDNEGNKSFISGGEKKGNFYSFNDRIKDQVIIAEGYSTAATVYESTKIPTVAAMDAGNLPAVAENLRAKYGEDLKITIAADNDHNRADNPGVTFAQKAADLVGGKVVVPNFTQEEKDKGLTDFNDMAKSRGKEAVKDEMVKQNKDLDNVIQNVSKSKEENEIEK